MMLDLSTAPSAILRLAEWLLQGGIRLETVAFDSAGNQLLRGIAARGTVEVLADRGQWLVTVAPRGTNEYFDTAVWTACITRTEVTLDIEPLEVQVEYLITLLKSDAMEGCTIECLLEARHQRAYRGMGLI